MLTRLLAAIVALRGRWRAWRGTLVFRSCRGDEWAPVPWSHAREACCDCFLVHTVDHRTDALGRLHVRKARDVRATHQLRRDRSRAKEARASR